MSADTAPESRLIVGDCLDVMREWDESVIDLTVTSPPYDNMRDYKGFAFEFEAIARELYRVAKKKRIYGHTPSDCTGLPATNPRFAIQPCSPKGWRKTTSSRGAPRAISFSPPCAEPPPPARRR